MCAQLGADQVLVTAHGGFGVVAPSVAGDTLPADTAALGHECDVTVARALLVRISRAQHGAGPVFMGAMTCIGNAPNFMVRSIASERGIRMPSFVGYVAWSCAVLLPVFALVTVAFVRP